MSNYDKWYDKNAVDGGDNYTWGEVVWKAARKALREQLRVRRQKTKGTKRKAQ